MENKQTKSRILLIEDEEMLSSMYKTKFEKEGFSVEIAKDGEEGVQKASSGEYDILLIDIILPKLNGFSVLKSIREMEKYSSTQVLMLTNLGQKEDIDKAKNYGANDYLVKANFTPSQVLEKIKSMLSIN